MPRYEVYPLHFRTALPVLGAQASSGPPSSGSGQIQVDDSEEQATEVVVTEKDRTRTTSSRMASAHSAAQPSTASRTGGEKQEAKSERGEAPRG